MSIRKFLTAIVLLLLTAPIVVGAGGRLCFSRGKYIFLQEPNGRVKRVVKGSQPAISPDGQTIAFVTNTGNWKKSDVHVNLLDIPTGKTRSISTLNAFQSYRPVWSPDGRQLAVQIAMDHKQAFITVDPRTGEYRVIPSNLEPNYIWLNSWMPDGSSVILNDLQYVYQLALDGHVVRQLPIQDFGNVYISSLTRFSFSPDGRFLMFDSAMVPDDVGIAAIYLWDIGAERLSRLTSDQLGALNPKWLPSGNEIIFTGYVKGHYKPKSCIPYYDVYKISLNDKMPTILVRDAEDASYSTR